MACTTNTFWSLLAFVCPLFRMSELWVFYSCNYCENYLCSIYLSKSNLERCIQMWMVILLWIWVCVFGVCVCVCVCFLTTIILWNGLYLLSVWNPRIFKPPQGSVELNFAAYDFMMDFWSVVRSPKHTFTASEFFFAFLCQFSHRNCSHFIHLSLLCCIARMGNAFGYVSCITRCI